MLRASLAGLLLASAFLLSACGGGDATSAAPAAPAPSASGVSNVVKGLVRNGVVTAWGWREGGYAKLGTGRTDANGDFRLDVSGIEVGEVLKLELGVSDDPAAPTAMLCDVARCGSGVRGDWVPLDSGLGLASWARVGSDGGLEVMPLTPLSTLLVRYAESVGGGRLDAAAVAVARQRVAALLGMTPEELMARPGNVDNSLWLGLASPQAVKLSLLSAAFAELATQNGVGIGEVVEFFAGRFLAHDGHLLQAGELGSLQDLYTGVSLLLAAPGAPVPEAWVGDWMAAATASLQAGERNLPSCGLACGDVDSGAFLAALGTGDDTLGGDLRRLLVERNVSRLEDLVAAELAHYAWLASDDSVALATSAFQIAVISATQALGGGAVAQEGLTLVRDGNVLQFDGVLNGLAVDLDVTVPPLLDMLQSYVPGAPPVFRVGARGTLQNGRMRASIDGTLAIDSTGTDLLPLQRAINNFVMASVGGDPAAIAAAQSALLTAIADLLRRGEATFTIEGSAGIARLEAQGDTLVETSRLAIAGAASLWVDMDGRSGGQIAARGSVARGGIALPNGDRFDVDPAKGHYLRFALGADGTAEASFAAHVLGHAAAVSGDGRLGALGALLGRLRDNVALTVETLTLDPDGILADLVADLATLTLTVSGQAVIPDYGHRYWLTLADGVLRISQPDSDEVALQVTAGERGVLLAAGGQWWLVGLDLAAPDAPALLISHSGGGEWRRPFSLPSWPVLLAGSGAAS